METNTLTEPHISFIIPVYNTPASYLDDCLKSISPLTFEKEIILVDDGSTLKETKQFLSSVSHITHIIYQQNGGASKARNTGIKAAKSKYIFCLDSDDKLNTINFCEAFNFLLQNPSIDVLYSDFNNFGSRSDLGKSRPYDKAFLYLSGNYIAMCSFFKKEVWLRLRGFDESLEVCEDYDFWVRASLEEFQFHYFEKPIFFYRRVADGKSLSQTKSILYPIAKEKIKSKISIQKLSRDDLHNYVLNSFKHNKINVGKLFLSLISEKIVAKLVNVKIFKSKYFID